MKIKFNIILNIEEVYPDESATEILNNIHRELTDVLSLYGQTIITGEPDLEFQERQAIERHPSRQAKVVIARLAGHRKDDSR